MDWLPIYFVTLLLVAFLLVIAAVGHDLPGARHRMPVAEGPASAMRPGQPLPMLPGTLSGSRFPGVGDRVFDDDRLLVAYSGTAATSSLGVLGDGSPEEVMPRLIKSAQGFGITGRPVQPVFELIVTVAHAGPTRSGQYNSDIDAAQVQAYIDAAHRHGALVVLNLQPGRSRFLEVAQRWEWALKDPVVGLALDPEWRMSQGGVPGQRIGSVSAEEINQVSRWLADLTVAQDLPEKLFVLHQFRRDMIRNVAAVEQRERLAMVQHHDGFGPPRAKVAAFRAIARPDQFTLGFKLFLDEDVPGMQPVQVLKLRPRVSLVTFQ